MAIGGTEFGREGLSSRTKEALTLAEGKGRPAARSCWSCASCRVRSRWARVSRNGEMSGFSWFMESKAGTRVLVLEEAECAWERLVFAGLILACDTGGRALLVKDEMNGARIACMEYGADGSGHGNGRVISLNEHLTRTPRLLYSREFSGDGIRCRAEIVEVEYGLLFSLFWKGFDHQDR